MEEVDVVFHFAGQTSLYAADTDPVCDYQANVLPMFLMLEACKKNDVHPDILFTGTSTIVGLPEELPVNETFPDQPVTIYDAHKLMAETYLKCYARMGLARGVTLRLTNVYGPGPKCSSEDRGILNMMVNRALSGKNVTVYGEGKFIRDYVYVDDFEEAQSEKFLIFHDSGSIFGREPAILVDPKPKQFAKKQEEAFEKIEPISETGVYFDQNKNVIVHLNPAEKPLDLIRDNSALLRHDYQALISSGP